MYLMMPHIFGRSLGVPPSRVFRRKRDQKRGKKKNKQEGKADLLVYEKLGEKVYKAIAVWVWL